jgi:hypothetical protein
VVEISSCCLEVCLICVRRFFCGGVESEVALRKRRFVLISWMLVALRRPLGGDCVVCGLSHRL